MGQRSRDVQPLRYQLLEAESGWSARLRHCIGSVGGGGWGDVVVQLGVGDRGVWRGRGGDVGGGRMWEGERIRPFST